MEENNYPKGAIILGVYIHCEGCGNEVLKCLLGYEGVEGVEIDAKNQKVIVKGKKANPMKVAERLRKKTAKHVQLLHPKLVKEDKDKEKKVEPPKENEVVLKVYIHCEGCAKEVKHCIYDMEGVERVDVDMKKNEVMVKGSMDPNKLVEFISKRGGRHAEIVTTQSELRQVEEGDDCCYGYDDLEQAAVLHAPQLFSDENPNSCSLM